jgi:hypothetical protein
VSEADRLDLAVVANGRCRPSGGGTRIAGFLLRQAAASKWGAATYAVKLTGGDDWHRDLRGDRSVDAEASPYAPDADDYRPVN